MSDNIVYFDGCTTFGKAAGSIQIELEANMLDPRPDGSVEVRRAVTGRLRCSNAAAMQLIAALQSALEMANKEPSDKPLTRN
ncbi:hypothetical protein [Leisingera sp. ANG-M1]|uniref:hypothetical protein n=1 Tax=Leisingera sp. ANG-M1 TaxID=1577895 RepID=UPI000689C1B7|nr:hypothetical protein [Leisingera sp. ANG-M1]